MEVKQIYELTNTIAGEILGKTDIVKEDLTGIVDLGTEIFNANAVDKYVKSLVNHIGKVIFVNRPYAGSTPSVLMDGWEFGSVLEKIQAELPVATENESWELEDGQSYDPNVFYQPKVSAKFFNSKTTFEIDCSFTELQVKQSFSSAEQYNGFVSMLYDAVDKALTIRIDGLVQRTINNMTAETVYSEFAGASLSSASGVRAVNVLKLYNDKYNKSLTLATAITDPEFIRFASYIMGVYTDRLSKISTSYNIGGKARFTPRDSLHVILLSDFEKAAAVYLQSDTYHDAYVRLPNAETVPYWQGTGDDGWDIEDITAVHVQTPDNHEVSITGLLGVMFDRNALGVCNQDRRVTTNYNPKAEFYTNFYKADCSYFNDENENFVCFFAA